MLTVMGIKDCAFFALALFALLLQTQVVQAAPSFDVRKSLGNLSPFFTPKPAGGLVGGLGTGMPEECSLEQVHLMQRHGSRQPLETEVVFTQNLSDVLNAPDVTSLLDESTLPEEWSFVQGPERWSNVLGSDNLTAVGRRECFDHGVWFRLAYPDMPFEHLLVGNQDRVVECAEWFRAGLFGRYQFDISTLSLIEEDNVTISSITPMDTCPEWSYNFGADPVTQWGDVYLPPIVKRFNKVLSPLELSTDDVHGALYACAYELAAFGNTTWCDVFTPTEIKNFEYELDVLMRGAFGYGLPGNMGPVLGSLFVNNLVDRMTNSSANKTFLEFGHDTTIDMALTALGLAKDDSFPATGPPNPNRKWRTTFQVPFAAMMVWEKWSCGESSTKVRLLLNGAPFSLAPLCAADRRSGACELDAFVQATAEIRSVKWGDTTWNSTCGDPGF
ncbi:hypothetical protein ACEPAI_9031 [Sanghuangporus weigelae]